METGADKAAIAHHRKADNVEQSLLQHLLGVAKLSEQFAGKIGLAQCGRLLGLVHDLGKYSAEFQAYIRSAAGLINPDEDDYVNAEAYRGKIDHSTAGAQIIWQHLTPRGPLPTWAAQLLSLAVISHHSGLVDCLTPVGKNNFLRRMNKEAAHTHSSEVWQLLENRLKDEIWGILSDPALVHSLQEATAKILKTNLVKGKEPMTDVVTVFKLGMLARLLFSCLIDADRIDTADFEKDKAAKLRQHGSYVTWEDLINRLETHVAAFTQLSAVDRARAGVSACCVARGAGARGLFTLSVPTGGGKTLASLRFALAHARKHHLDRIVYVIPFTSIIDQNAQVVRDILEDPRRDEFGSIVLEHHSNLTPQEQTWRAKILSENWDAPVVFTTAVQFLETLFGGGTCGARRMHQLARAVLIFDEIQTLPIRCIHMFCNAINFLVEECGSSVMLCTATQPLLGRLERKELGALKLSPQNEIVSNVDQLYRQLRRVTVHDVTKAGGWSEEEIAALAAKQVQELGSCLVVVNTKAAARGLCVRLRSMAVGDVFHLSTAMCPAHRMLVLSQMRHKLDKGPLVCVSTQLIEAGVDVDFAAVIRFVAGLDSIAQAAGRCNRNGRRAMGHTFVVNPDKEKIDALADIKAGIQVTERIFSEMKRDPQRFDGDLLSPAAMQEYYHYYFFNRAQEMPYRVERTNKVIGRDDTLLELLSTNARTPVAFAAAPALRQSFAAAGRVFAAIDTPTRGLVVPYGERGRTLIGELCSAFEIHRRFDVLREAQRYSVNVFPQMLDILQSQGAVRAGPESSGILYLDERFYSEEFGVSTEAITGLAVEIQ